MTYRTLSDHYKEQFGCKVYKLSIDAGFTCPNRDGTCGTGGCIFCSGRGSGDFAATGGSVTEQLEAAKSRVAAKNKGGKYIAYFQALPTPMPRRKPSAPSTKRPSPRRKWWATPSAPGRTAWETM